MDQRERERSHVGEEMKEKEKFPPCQKKIWY